MNYLKNVYNFIISHSPFIIILIISIMAAQNFMDFLMGFLTLSGCLIGIVGFFDIMRRGHDSKETSKQWKKYQKLRDNQDKKYLGQ